MRERIFWLDFLRVAAAFAVVCLHASAFGVTLNPSISNPGWWVANILDSFTRWSVPIFVMVSGSMLLSRPPDDSPATFYRRRFGRLLIPLVVWTIFYLAVKSVAEGNFDLARSLKLIVTGQPFYHMWYLYMLVGLYLVTPFIQYFIWKAPRNWLVWSIVVSFAIGAFDQLSTTWFSVGGGSFLSLYPANVGFYLAGYYLVTRERPLLKLSTAVIGFIASGLGIALMTGLLYPFVGDTAWAVMYTMLNPLVISMSICIFCAFQRIEFGSESQGLWRRLIVKRLAPLMLGVYLIHPFWLEVLTRLGMRQLLETMPGFGIPTLAVLVFLLAVISAAVLRIIPGLRRII